MEIDLDTLRRMTRLSGFDWSDAELEAVRPALARALELLARLETMPLREIEPATQYRVI
jgi:Asp-tRNA(Asn)/Glu-tRNA(Gln) amidotransferase C subunit